MTIGAHNLHSVPNTRDNITRMVPDGFNTRKMVADKIGRSLTTIKNWEGAGWIRNDGDMQAGLLVVRLYSDEYVNKVIMPMSISVRQGKKTLSA